MLSKADSLRKLYSRKLNTHSYLLSFCSGDILWSERVNLKQKTFLLLLVYKVSELYATDVLFALSQHSVIDSVLFELKILSSLHVSVEETKMAEDFSVERFVNNLRTEGSNCSYENTYEDTGSSEDIPWFYDEKMFKKGQNFFRKYRTSVFLGCLMALVLGFAHPMTKLLVMTNKSSTPLTAYKRYSATILHMCTWYESDLKPGSKLWSSLKKVRKMHYLASKQGRIHHVYQITQYDLSLVLIGFMGLPVVRSNLVGIHDATEDEMKGFIHFWRVIGYILGIEDRFNLCRDSVEETKQICVLLLKRDVISEMKEGDDCFDSISRAFIEGMQGVFPVINYNETITYLNMVVKSISSDNLEFQEKIRGWNYISLLAWIMSYNLGRIVVNSFVYMIMLMLRYFPVFAYPKFGIEHSHVSI